MANFTYDDSALEHLQKRDKKMAALIERYGKLEREVEPDLLHALVGSIIAQQISGKAAVTIEKRLREKLPEFTAEALLALTPEAIQSCGMSLKKASYIHASAEAAGNGRLDGLERLDNPAIVERLTALPGIGVWTAEMMLIFSLERPDVLSFGDFGIRKGLMRLYGHRELPRERFERYRKRFSPYGSVAAFYLWELAGEPTGA